MGWWKSARAGAGLSRVVSDRRNEQGVNPWNLSGSSLWTELCAVPTAALRAAQPRHPRNGMRSLQDCQPAPHPPHPAQRLQAGWRSGWRPAGKGGPSPMPTPQAWPSGWGTWCGSACRGGPTRAWWWRRPRPVRPPWRDGRCCRWTRCWRAPRSTRSGRPCWRAWPGSATPACSAPSRARCRRAGWGRPAAPRPGAGPLDGAAQPGRGR